MKYLIDTNIAIDYPSLFEDIDKEIYITTSVLRELDGLKKNRNLDLASNARRAAIYIAKNRDILHFIDDDETEINYQQVDDKLLDVAQQNDFILLTNDIYLKIKCLIKGIKTEGIGNQEDYSGIYYWLIDMDENLQSPILENFLNTLSLPENINLRNGQYLIICNKNAETIDKYGKRHYEIVAPIYKNDNGEIKEVKPKPIRNYFIDKITPRNPEQQCLFDLLNDENKTIVYAGGGYRNWKKSYFKQLCYLCS